MVTAGHCPSPRPPMLRALARDVHDRPDDLLGMNEADPVAPLESAESWRNIYPEGPGRVEVAELVTP